MSNFKKYLKLLLKSFVVLFLFFWIFLFTGVALWEGTNWDPAQTTDATSETTDEKEWLVQNLYNILRVLYVLMSPLLMIWWLGLDNSLVYWEVLHLDQALWKLWNMMKNFANFALWFIFIYSVLLYFFYQKSEKYQPKKVLPKLIVWSIWIQASWFIVAALIDLSTILVYGLWWLPLKVLKWTQVWDKPVPTIVSTINLESISTILSWTDSTIYFKYWEHILVPCLMGTTSSSEGWWDTGSQKTDYINSFKLDWWKVNSQFCILSNGRVWKFEEAMKYWDWTEWINLEDVYASDDDIAGLYWEWEDVITISDLVDKVKWMTWPLMAMYSSLLSSSWFVMVWSAKSLDSLSMQFIMQLIVAIALIIPLVTLVIILIVRVWVLWLVIGLSPIIVLSEVFEFKLWWDKATLKSILWLIFLPAIAVFAISISIIFLTVLNSSLVIWWGAWVEEKTVAGKLWVLSCNSDWVECEGVDTSANSCYQMPIWNVMCFKKPSMDVWLSPFLDVFSRTIVNFFWVALMWAVVFSAMKTSAITNNIVNWIEDLWKQAAKTVPIIPIPWHWMQSVWSLWRAAQQIQRIPWLKQEQQFSSWLSDMVDELWSTMSWEKSRAWASIQTPPTSVTRSWYWEHVSRQITQWSDLMDFQDQIVQYIKSQGHPEVSNLWDILSKPDIVREFGLEHWFDAWNASKLSTSEAQEQFFDENIRPHQMKYYQELYNEIKSSSSPFTEEDWENWLVIWPNWNSTFLIKKVWDTYSKTQVEWTLPDSMDKSNLSTLLDSINWEFSSEQELKSILEKISSKSFVNDIIRLWSLKVKIKTEDGVSKLILLESST